MIDLRKKSALMRGDNVLYSSVFKTFKAMPFLYELKLLIDWTFTTTSLDLFKWLKFEAIYDLLFLTKCTMKSYYGRKVGTKVPNLNKFFSGGLFFILMLIIVFGPLVLFSSLNPTNRSNKVTGAAIEIQLSFVQDEVPSNFTIYKNSHITKIMATSDIEWTNNSFDKILATKNYNKEQVQTVKMVKNSELNWDVTLPTFKYIMKMLNNPHKTAEIYINLKYSFLRELSVNKNLDNNFAIYSYIIFPQSNDTKVETSTISLLQKILLECDSNGIYRGNFSIDKFYNPAIRLSNSPIPFVISSDDIQYKNVTMSLECRNDKYFWELSQKENPEEGIEFYTFSDLVSPTSASYDVLTFYVTFILIIGKFVRSIISGEAERVIYTEMPRPQKLLYICEGIKISRYKKDLEREDKLYYVLIDLLRSPEMLKMITKPSLKFNDSAISDSNAAGSRIKSTNNLNSKKKKKDLIKTI